MVLNNFNAKANAITTPIIVSTRMDASPSVSRTEDDSILKSDGQLTMFADYGSEILPSYCDKFAFKFADLFRDVTSFYQNCKPSRVPKQIQQALLFLTSLCIGNLSVGPNYSTLLSLFPTMLYKV